jgi:SOS-response transcriptional repressor LexA
MIHKDKLRALIKDSDYSNRSLSLAVGTNPTLIADIFKRPSGNATLDKLSALASALGCSISDFTDYSEATAPEDELENLNRDYIALVGSVQAGSWREEAATPQDVIQLGLAFPDLPKPQFAYKVEGESMNKHALPGHFWVCHAYEDANNEAASGHFVVVERSRGQLIERTVKKLVFSSNGNMEFWPDSHDDNWQSPYIPAEVTGQTDETYRIIARARIVLSERL